MDTLHRVVQAVQLATLVVTAAFVILLFTNEPAEPAATPDVGSADTGATLYATRCASCHAPDGGGGFGPALGGGIVAQRYPDPADEAAVVAGGRGSMPSFGDSLSPAQVAAVVEYTRTGLG